MRCGGSVQLQRLAGPEVIDLGRIVDAQPVIACPVEHRTEIPEKVVFLLGIDLTEVFDSLKCFFTR